jgi:hypothetical protein
VPPLAHAFERFLCQKGQSEVAKQLPSDWARLAYGGALRAVQV